MIRKYDPSFIKSIKKVDVKIRKSFKQRIALFDKDPLHPQLNNHPLKREYQGHRSIDINNDYRALYTEKIEGKDRIAYFVIFGTHQQLYGS